MNSSQIIADRQQVLPVNIESMIEDMGLELVRKGSLDPAISGQIEKIQENKYRITVNASESYFRRRFSMAHELAHYILHRDLIGDGLDDTPAYRSTDIGRFHNKNVGSRHEAEANRLAADLLMPERQVRDLFDKTGGDVPGMAKRFLVSPQAMAYRLQSLGLSYAHQQRS